MRITPSCSSPYCGGPGYRRHIFLILILFGLAPYIGRLAASVQVAGIDMTGTRMVSTGSRMVMTSRTRAVERCRVRLHVYMRGRS